MTPEPGSRRGSRIVLDKSKNPFLLNEGSAMQPTEDTLDSHDIDLLQRLG